MFISEIDVYWRRRGLIALGIFLIALILTLGADSELTSFEIHGEGGRKETVEIPYLAPGWGPGDYRLEGELVLDWFASKRYQIVPDDQLLELSINEKFVDLSGILDESIKDVHKGFHIDLGDYLRTGTNRVVFVFRDFGGEMGMSIQPSVSDWRYLVICSFWCSLVLWLFIGLLQFRAVKTSHSLCYFLILASGLIRAWYVIVYNPVDHIWSDPARHWEQGVDLLRIDLMSMTDPIGYQLYVALLAKFSLKIPALVAYCTILLSLIGPWLWYRFFRELQSNKTLALAGWAALSCLPSWIAIYGYFMQETLMLPLLGAALWFTWRCRRKADLRNFAIMVFLWIAVGLTRGIAIPLAAVCCTWLWMAQEQKFQKAMYSILILLLIMGPLTYRSYKTVGHFAPHGMGHLNVIYAQSGKKVIEIEARIGDGSGGWKYGFGSPSTGAQPFSPFSDWQTRRTGTVNISVDLAKGFDDWKREIEKNAMGFRDYLWITKENLIFLFFAESWPDTNLSRVVDILNSALRWIWAPFLLILVVGVIWHSKKFRGNWLLPSMLIVWFIVQGLVPIAINEGRYRKPFEGLAVAQLILLIAVIQGAIREAAPTDHWLNRLRKFIKHKKTPDKLVLEH
jgi:hypothetical protein